MKIHRGVLRFDRRAGSIFEPLIKVIAAGVQDCELHSVAKLYARGEGRATGKSTFGAAIESRARENGCKDQALAFPSFPEEHAMPTRILCLSAEAADICAKLGAWDRVVAVSAFARQDGLPQRPVVSGFSSCDCERAMKYEPDLVITFSDVQAEIAAQFIRAGCPVLATNQRSLAEIGAAIRMIGGVIGCVEEAEELAKTFAAEVAALAVAPKARPKVYFEEWADPLICGIGWVGEIIELAGGIDVFSERRGRASSERSVSIEEVIAADPDIILASWCGKRVDLPAIRARSGFAELSATKRQNIHPLHSNLILQPGPSVLKGARQIQRIIERWAAV